MAKSNLVLLQEAIAAGDLGRAAELTNKLAKVGKMGAKPAKAPSKPAKASSKKTPVRAKKTATTPRKPAKARQDVEIDESSYLAPSRPPGSEDYMGGKKFIGPDGKEHTFAKRVSMQGMKFVNKFKPDGYKDLSPKEKNVEKQIKTLRTVPRPGQRGAQRDVSTKVKARCTICRDEVLVYPWEVETVDGESSFRCSKKSCVKAR